MLEQETTSGRFTSHKKGSAKHSQLSKTNFFETSFLGSFNRQEMGAKEKEVLAQLDRTKMYLKSASEYARRLRSKDRKE